MTGLRQDWTGGLHPAVPGLALGLAGAYSSSQVLGRFIDEVARGGPVTLLLVASTVAPPVTLAALLPTRRAARTDPMTVLRGE